MGRPREGLPWPLAHVRGGKLQCKKIDAILCLQVPANIKELCSFLGMATHCHDMWPHCAHVLALLTALIESKDFHWGPEQQHAFSEMKALMVTDVPLARIMIKAN